LLQHAARLVCFEKSPTWIAGVRQLVPTADIRPLPQDVAEAISLVSNEITSASAVFVDGSPGQWRVQVILAAASREAKLILAHDWSLTQSGYGYHTLGGRLEGYRKYAYQCIKSKVRTVAFVRGAFALPDVPDHHPCD
jgi:hypothetical protein